MNNHRIVELASPKLFPVCSPKLISGRGQLKQLKDITSYTLIHDGQVSWNRWFEAFNITISEKLKNIYFPNTSQAITAARLGYGVALCNTFETQAHIREGDLIRLSQKSIDEENSYYLYCKHQRDSYLKARLFEDWIIKNCLPI